MSLDKKRQLFRDQQLQQDFESKGYVAVDFLTKEEVETLSAAFNNLNGDLGEPAFASTIMSRDTGYREAVSALVKNSFARAVADVFENARIFFGNFNVKYPGNNLGTVPLHQDPSFLDERFFNSFAIWVPLVDTTTQNGCLQVIPGSHTIITQPRCGSYPFPYAGIAQILLERYGQQLPMKAGQAYIGNPALFHASPPNAGTQPRIAAAVLVAHKESEMRYYHCRQLNGTYFAEMFEADHDYYVTAPLFSRPAEDRYKLLETIALDQAIPAADELVEILEHRIKSRG